MSPDEWRRIKEVLQQAVGYDAAARVVFLDRVCADNPELRRQVEELLAYDRRMGDFLEPPAVDSTADPALREAPEQLSGRRLGAYQILGEIGRGGMGSVYVADRADGQFRKRVAIKIVRPQLNTEDVLRRFRNERQVLADLEHPNIARLLDGGATAEGLPYLVMEHVDGVRIDEWCRLRTLPVRERLRLFRNVCAAVQFAHSKQVIHRDIKPGNILVMDDGAPKLLDFGIAKVLDPDTSAPAGASTIGSRAMTPEYASPEQVRGETAGPAADIYALGVVLYQLLTGRLPYRIQRRDVQQIARVVGGEEPTPPSEVALLPDGEMTAANISAERGESPTSLSRVLAGDLDAIVLKALRKEPDERYTSVAQFSADVDRYLEDRPVEACGKSLVYRGRKLLRRRRALIAATAIGALGVLGIVFGMGRFGSGFGRGTDTGARSIAVLPFENLSGSSEQEYFADGITDALIGDLSRIHGLRVISRTSVMSYKAVRRRLPEIARALGVQTIAEGSVLRANNRLRIDVRVVDAANDRPVWSGAYEGELQNVMSLQSQMAESIAEEVHVTLSASGRARFSRSRRVDLGAYDAYLKGRRQYFSDFSSESLERAIDWFHQALKLDPTYAPAYAGLADCYYMASNQYFPPTDVMPKAKWASEKAIALDDTLGEAHATLALVRSVFEFRRAEAEEGFKRALDLKPGDAQVHSWYGLHLAGVGRFDEAVAQIEQAQTLDPASPAMNAYIGVVLYLAHRYDEVIRRMQPLVEVNPENTLAHAFLALAYEQKREWTKGIQEMERAYALWKEPQSLAQLGHIYAMSGRTADARSVLRQLRDLSSRRYVTAYDIALLYAGLGERDEAFRWLQKVEQDRSEWFANINVDPRLDSFHSDPRFAAILRAVGLAQ